MAKCSICGKEIVGRKCSINVDGSTAENTCWQCGFSAYKLTKDNADSVNEGKAYFDALLSDPKIGKQQKDFVSLVLNIDPGKITVKNEVLTNGNTSSETYTANSITKQTWTRIVKTLSIIEIIACVILGAVVSNIIDSDMLFFGLLAGGFTGVVMAAFNMLFVEISENIATGVEMLASMKDKKDK